MYKKQSKAEEIEKPRKKRAKEVEILIAGKKVPEVSSSKSATPVTSPAAKKQKKSAAEKTADPTEDFNEAMERVLNKFKKKTPVAEASTPKVTISSDVMNAVNQKLVDMTSRNQAHY